MTNIEELQDDEVRSFTGQDVLNAKRFAKECPNPLAMLSKLIAPSVFGLDIVKQVLMCQVLVVPFLDSIS